MVKPTTKKRISKHLWNVGLGLVSFALMTVPANASDPIELAGKSLGNEGGQVAAKEALNAALKVARSKPAMTTATGIVCLACVPVAGAAASPGLCIACGILIAKTFG